MVITFEGLLMPFSFPRRTLTSSFLRVLKIVTHCMIFEPFFFFRCESRPIAFLSSDGLHIELRGPRKRRTVCTYVPFLCIYRSTP